MTELSPPPGFGGPLQQSPQQLQADKIKRPKDRRVSWAAGEKLCQKCSARSSKASGRRVLKRLPDRLNLPVLGRIGYTNRPLFPQHFVIRLFVAEDAPTLSGSAQEQLQAKQTRNLHIFNSIMPSPAPDAPPGFGGVVVKPKPDHFALAAIVPQISWRSPSTVHLDPTWHVMAGGASLETGLQKQREVRMLEAVYPRPSSIPESPAEPVEAQEPYDDSKTPQIPLVPLEEEDVLDGSEMSCFPLGPCFLARGSSGQAGGQTISPPALGLSNGRPDKVKQPVGDGLPGPMQDTSHARKESAWRDPSAIYAARSSFVDHSSDPTSGRPTSAGPISDVHTSHTNAKHNGGEPDVAAAAAAAFAALAKSQEKGSMIDKELLIQILKDPGLIHSLSAKQPFMIAHSKSEPPSSIALNGIPRGPNKINQAQAMNGVTGPGSHWINPPSTSYLPVAAGGQEGSRSRSGEAYSSAGERFQRTAGSDERLSTLMHGSMGNGQLYTDLTNGRVGAGTLPRPSNLNSSDMPPGFGSGKSNGNLPPGFGSKSVSKIGSQTIVAPPVIATPARPLSRTDEQYFKSLIMQHGCKSADDDDHGRAGMDITEGSSGVKPSNTHSTPELKRWYGMEELDGARQLNGARPERNGRERRDNERIGMGPALETVARKSRKVCIYFGTPRGCRNGDNCTFVHEVGETEKTRTERVRPAAPTQLQYAKRLKVDG